MATYYIENPMERYWVELACSAILNGHYDGPRAREFADKCIDHLVKKREEIAKTYALD